MMSCCCSREPGAINGRQYRPLLPKPNANTSTAVVTTPYSSCSCCLHRPKLTVPFNHNQHQLAPARSRRWSPTPEQLDALEEMYNGGTRTPSPEQIQRIASKLRCFGHIEGKNVFFWFQNHKARERQQKRRHPETTTNPSVGARRKSGLSRKCFGSAKGKDKATSNCSAISEEPAESMNRALGSQQIVKRFAADDQEPEALELFPANSFSSGDHGGVREDGNHHQVWMDENCNSFVPSHFFEFLPLKK